MQDKPNIADMKEGAAFGNDPTLLQSNIIDAVGRTSNTVIELSIKVRRETQELAKFLIGKEDDTEADEPEFSDTHGFFGNLLRQLKLTQSNLSIISEQLKRMTPVKLDTEKPIKERE